MHQLTALGSWQIVAQLSSPQFADQHIAIVWALVVVVNGLLYFLPSFCWYWLSNRLASLGARTWPLALWCVVYIAALFVFLPAGDGP